MYICIQTGTYTVGSTLMVREQCLKKKTNLLSNSVVLKLGVATHLRVADIPVCIYELTDPNLT
jgi:hypothetical protein